jgi:hypothetical protein
MSESLGAQEHRRCRQCDDRHPPAVADRLGAEGLARNRVEHADQIGRHDERLTIAPGHDPFVLKGDFEPRALILVEPLDRRPAAQEALGGPPLDIDHLAAEEELARRRVEDRGDRVLVPALRLMPACGYNASVTIAFLTMLLVCSMLLWVAAPQLSAP